MDTDPQNTQRILTDHDVIVTLKANFDNFVTRYGKDIQDIKDGTTAKINDHENRISAMEKLRDELNPEQLVKQHQANTEWIQQFKVTWKVTLGVIALASGVTGIIATLVALINGFIRIGK